MKFRTIYFLMAGLFIVASCHSSRGTSKRSNSKKKTTQVYKPTKTPTRKPSSANISKDVATVLNEAKKYLGTPYKYGGTNRSGLDCSGLVYNSFEAIGIKMPRMSSEQAKQGVEIKLKDVQVGDLVFFNTSGSSISHVGIVENISDGEIFFIHSSTSKGVIISSLEETYWNKRFVKATRVL